MFLPIALGLAEDFRDNADVVRRTHVMFQVAHRFIGAERVSWQVPFSGFNFHPSYLPVGGAAFDHLHMYWARSRH
jgi:hypothetical protein